MSEKIDNKFENLDNNDQIDACCNEDILATINKVDSWIENAKMGDIRKEFPRVLALKRKIESDEYNDLLAFSILFYVISNDDIKKRKANDLFFSYFDQTSNKQAYIKKSENQNNKKTAKMRESLIGFIQEVLESNQKDISKLFEGNHLKCLLKDVKESFSRRKDESNDLAIKFFYNIPIIFVNYIQSKKTPIFLDRQIDENLKGIDLDVYRDGSYLYGSLDKTQNENIDSNIYSFLKQTFWSDRYLVESNETGYRVQDTIMNMSISFCNKENKIRSNSLESKYYKNKTFCWDKINILLDVCFDSKSDLLVELDKFTKKTGKEDEDVDFNEFFIEKISDKNNLKQLKFNLINNWPYMGLFQLNEGDYISNMKFKNIKNMNETIGCLAVDRIFNFIKNDLIDFHINGDNVKLIKNNYKYLGVAFEDKKSKDHFNQRATEMSNNLFKYSGLENVIEDIVIREFLLANKRDGKIDLNKFGIKSKTFRKEIIDTWIKQDMTFNDRELLLSKIKNKEKKKQKRKDYIQENLKYSIGTSIVEGKDGKSKIKDMYKSQVACVEADVNDKTTSDYNEFKMREYAKDIRDDVQYLKNKKLQLDGKSISIISQIKENGGNISNYNINSIISKMVRMSFDSDVFIEKINSAYGEISGSTTELQEVYKKINDILVKQNIVDFIKEGTYESIEIDLEKSKSFWDELENLESVIYNNKNLNKLVDLQTLSEGLTYSQKGFMTKDKFKEYVGSQSEGSLVFVDIQDMAFENRKHFFYLIDYINGLQDNEDIDYSELLEAGDPMTHKILKLAKRLHDKYRDKIKIAKGGDELFIYIKGGFQEDLFASYKNELGLDIRYITSQVDNKLKLEGTVRKLDNMSRIADISKTLEKKIKLLNQDLGLEIDTSTKIKGGDIDIQDVADHKESILKFMNKNRFFEVMLLDLYIGNVDYIPLSQNFYLSIDDKVLKINYKSEPMDMTESKIYFDFDNIKRYISNQKEFEKNTRKYVNYVKKLKKIKYINNDESESIGQLQKDIKSLKLDGSPFVDKYIYSVIEFANDNVSKLRSILKDLNIFEDSRAIHPADKKGKKGEVPLKKYNSIYNKLLYDNDFDLSRSFGDVLRGSMVYTSKKDLDQGVAKFNKIINKKDWTVSRKDRVLQKTACDHRYQVKTDEGVVFEIQFHLDKLYKFKNKGIDIDKYWSLYSDKIQLLKDNIENLELSFENIIDNNASLKDEDYIQSAIDALTYIKKIEFLEKIENKKGKIQAGSLYKMRKKMLDKFGGILDELSIKIGGEKITKEFIEKNIYEPLENIEASINNKIKEKYYPRLAYYTSYLYKDGNNTYLEYANKIFKIIEKKDSFELVEVRRDKIEAAQEVNFEIFNQENIDSKKAKKQELCLVKAHGYVFGKETKR